MRIFSSSVSRQKRNRLSREPPYSSVRRLLSGDRELLGEMAAPAREVHAVVASGLDVTPGQGEAVDQHPDLGRRQRARDAVVRLVGLVQSAGVGPVRVTIGSPERVNGAIAASPVIAEHLPRRSRVGGGSVVSHIHPANR
jgi:hypothetical protein